MQTQSPVAKVLFVVLLLGIAAWPIVALSKSTGGISPRLTLSNRVTQGKVLYIGPSTVSSAPAVVLYGYNAPEFPRKPWSFQREQVVAPKDLARFQVGMTVSVEYSHASPGTSRLKGYGQTNSVLLDEFGFMFLVLLVLLVFSAVSWSKKLRPL
jgi:hypothetical protein